VLVFIGSDFSLRDATLRLDGLWKATEAIHNTFQMMEIGVLRALAFWKMSRIDEATAVLERLMPMAAAGGWIRPFVELGLPMAEMLKYFLKQNVTVDHIGRILTAFGDIEKVAIPQGSPAQLVSEPSVSAPPLIESLTNRESEILEMLAQRLQNKEIAERLFISHETVKTHLTNIYQKLNVTKRREAVERAYKLGILTQR
jgi:LuxR family maltose regulon positive regulatory protein